MNNIDENSIDSALLPILDFATNNSGNIGYPKDSNETGYVKTHTVPSNDLVLLTNKLNQNEKQLICPTSAEMTTMFAILEGYINSIYKDSGFLKHNILHPRSKGAIIKVLTEGSVKYYQSNKDNNTDSFTTNSWQLATAFFDFHSWDVSGNATNIILQHKGEMKFDSDYLQDGLKIYFKAKYTSTGAVVINFENNGILYNVYTNDGDNLKVGAIKANQLVSLTYSSILSGFVYEPPVYDSHNYLVSGDASNINLTSQCGEVLDDFFLYNGRRFSFVAKYTCGNEPTLTIDNKTYTILTNTGDKLQSGDIVANQLVKMTYYSNRRAFLKDENIDINEALIGGGVFAGDSVLNGCVALNGQKLYKSQVSKRFWDVWGTNSAENFTNGVCWSGSGYVYIDTEDTKEVGNKVFAEQTPISVGTSTGNYPYTLEVEGNKYNLKIYGQDGYELDGKLYYTNSTERPEINSNLYDNKTPTQAEMITDIKIASLFVAGTEVSVLTDAIERKFQNNIWILDKHISIGDYAFSQTTDPLLNKIGTISSINDDPQSIIVNNFNYVFDSDDLGTDNRKWVWDKVEVEGEQPEITEIYTKRPTTTEPLAVGQDVFNQQMIYTVIQSFYVNGFSINNSTTGENTFYVNEDDETKYLNTNGDIRYVEKGNVYFNNYCYSTPIANLVGKVSGIIYGLNTTLGILAPHGDHYIVFNGVSEYYTQEGAGISSGVRIYNQKYPSSIGTYTAFTSTTITYNDSVFTINDATTGEYVGTSGIKYYSKNALKPNRVYLSTTSRDYLNVVSYEGRNTILLSNGAVLHRYVLGDITEFNLPNYNNGYTLIGCYEIGINQFGTGSTIRPTRKTDYGGLPNIKGNAGIIQNAGGTSELFGSSGTSITVSTYGGHNGKNLYANARRINSNVFIDGAQFVVPRGYYVVYQIRVA